MRGKQAKKPAVLPNLVAPRLPGLDRLRGFVMVLMVLDHAWWYFSDANSFPRSFPHPFRPDPDFGFVAAFLTSWLPRFCAPVFIFLAGVGAFLQMARGKGAAELARFLFLRGVWLIVIELTLLYWIIYFSFNYAVIVPLILWAMGWAMIVLAGLVFLPSRWVGAVGLTFLVLHNAFGGFLDAEQMIEPFRTLWILLYQHGNLHLGENVLAIMSEPILPAAALMAVGYAAGEWFTLEASGRRRIMVTVGAILVACFVLVRGGNRAAEPTVAAADPATVVQSGYGDSRPWVSQPDSVVSTALSFVDCTPAPLSLNFLLMWMGPALLLLAWFEREGPRGAILAKCEGWLATFGRVPFFFFLLQWLLLHLMAIAVAIVLGRPTGWLFARFDVDVDRPVGWTPESGFPLWVVYVAWVATVLATYPICRWFAGVKQRNKSWWLSYL